MKIAILGGGFTGLTAAYRLSLKGHGITLFEKAEVLGGLAVGIKGEGWEWYLERAIHHIFSNDDSIIGLARDTGFEGLIFRSPVSASLYEEIPRQARDDFAKGKINYRIIPVDTPQDFLKFPYLSLVSKLRSGITLATLKLSPFLSFYESMTSEEFLRKTMGDEAWEVLWRQLFQKKFGKYAGNILASFFWARITKRTKSLGYFSGGFQGFITHLENKCISQGVTITRGYEVKNIIETKTGIRIDKNTYDLVISTLPTPVLTRIATGFFPEAFINRLKKIEHLHAVSLIIETAEPYLKKAYWLNVMPKDVPLTLFSQHTNFMDKKHYDGNHIAYTSWYVERENKLVGMNEKEIYTYIRPHLKKIAGKDIRPKKLYLFKAPFAQPIFDKTFVKNMPTFKTPIKNFYVANLDMTYPYDRGTNYAVKLGNEVSDLI